MNDPMQPEELTELLDDDLEMWAMGGTRILPKSALSTPIATREATATPPQSYPPVAYAPSIPPPAAKSSAPIWAAIIGMTSVFAISAVAGVVVLVLHHAAPEATVQASVPPQSTVDTTATLERPAPIATTDALPQTSNTTDTSASTSTSTSTKSAPIAMNAARAPIAPAIAKASGTLQTFAAGNGKPIFVDGKQVGVGGSRVKTACGKHSVIVGTGRAHTVDIPCTGVAITVGTPDGT